MEGLPTAQTEAHIAQEVAHHNPRHSPAAVPPSCQVAEAPPSLPEEAHHPIRPAHRVNASASHGKQSPCLIHYGKCLHHSEASEV